MRLLPKLNRSEPRKHLPGDRMGSWNGEGIGEHGGIRNNLSFIVKSFIAFSIFYFLFSTFSSPLREAHAAISNVSRIIPFQGTLTNSSGNYVADGNYSILFSIYTVASGGTAAWSETQTVATTNGAFSVNIGANDANGVNLALDTPPYYLGVKVGTNAEMSPRVQLGFSPFAMTSKNMSGVYTDASGNVGIGTTGPGALLDVAGTTLSGTGVLTLEAGGELTTAAGNDLNLNVPSTRSLFVKLAGATKVTMDNQGNVGIGTTNPGDKLHVNRNLRLAPYTSGDTTPYQNVTSQLTILHGAHGNPSYLSRIAFGNQYNPAGTNYDAIYTYIDWTSGWLYIKNNQQTKIQIGGGDEWGNQNIYLNPTGGNVGIGTTSPAQKLDVVGTVKATAFSGDGSGLTGVGGAPTGQVSFFNLASCPTGWTALTAAAGYAIVGRAANESIGSTVGTALSSLENRTHTHTGPSHTHNFSFTNSAVRTVTGILGRASGASTMTNLDASGGCCSQNTDTLNTFTDSGGTGATGTANTSNVMPYIQLLVCQKS